MASFWQLLGIFVCVFVASFGAAYGFSILAKSLRGNALLLAPDSVVRLKSNSNLYRTRFLGMQGDLLRFAAPISRELYVPIRKGESVTVEGSSSNGVVLFTSTVMERIPETHELLLQRPKDTSLIDRRECPRMNYETPIAVKVNGIPAALLNAGDRGAKLCVCQTFSKGDRIFVSLSSDHEDSGAWVLDACDPTGNSNGLQSVRVVFEELIVPPRYSTIRRKK